MKQPNGRSTVGIGGWIVLFIACEALCADRPRIDLNGAWDFYPDVGEAAFENVTTKPGKIAVPGAWQAQGYGQPGGSIPSSVVGSDITPAAYLRHNLTARCLYARAVVVSSAWRDQRVFLCVRRVYRYADVTVNGRRDRKSVV
jgi:beta-galactosidase/beta-glucuronidase